MQTPEAQAILERLIADARAAGAEAADAVLFHSVSSGVSWRCTAMAKAAPEDPYCGLAPAERLAKEPFPHLDLGDFEEPSTDDLKTRAAECEAAALAVKGVVNSSGAGAGNG